MVLQLRPSAASCEIRSTTFVQVSDVDLHCFGGGMTFNLSRHLVILILDSICRHPFELLEEVTLLGYSQIVLGPYHIFATDTLVLGPQRQALFRIPGHVRPTLRSIKYVLTILTAFPFYAEKLFLLLFRRVDSVHDPVEFLILFEGYAATSPVFDQKMLILITFDFEQHSRKRITIDIVEVLNTFGRAPKKYGDLHQGVTF